MEKDIQSNPFTPSTTRDDSLAGLVKQPQYAARFKQVLGDREPQFVSSLLSLGATMKDVEPKSIIGSAMIAAALDLPIDKNLGFAWIVPYNHEGRKVAQFQMGSRGYIQLAQRSSQYARMNSCPINKEVFVGYDAVGEPELDWSKYDPALPVWGYFFGFQLTNGFVKKAVWSVEKVRAHAKKFSQSYRSNAKIWRENFDGMGEKTVVSNTLRKWGPMSIQLQHATKADQAVITDIDAEPQYLDRGELEEGEVDARPAENPAKVAAAAAAATTQAATKTQPKPETKPANVVPMKQEEQKKPAPTTTQASEISVLTSETQPRPSNDEEKELAAAGLAPEQPKQPEPVTQAPVESQQQPEGPKECSEEQAKFKGAIEGAGYTFDDFLGWARKSIFPKGNASSTWSGIPEDKVKYLNSAVKGVLAGIATWKKSASK